MRALLAACSNPRHRLAAASILLVLTAAALIGVQPTPAPAVPLLSGIPVIGRFFTTRGLADPERLSETAPFRLLDSLVQRALWGTPRPLPTVPPPPPAAPVPLPAGGTT